MKRKCLKLFASGMIFLILSFNLRADQLGRHFLERNPIGIVECDFQFVFAVDGPGIQKMLLSVFPDFFLFQHDPFDIDGVKEVTEEEDVFSLLCNQ